MMHAKAGLIVLIAGVLAVSCGDSSHDDQNKAEVQPIDVQVVAARPENRSEDVEAVGTVRPKRSVTVSSKILSHIQAIHVEEGQPVRAGQPLIELDARELASALKGADAAVAAADDAVRAAEHALESAEAQLTLAESTHQRYRGLLEKESISQQEYDEINARMKSANAAVESARAQKEQAVAQHAQAASRTSSAGVMLGFATINSPVAGVVVERLADPGSLTAPGQPILRIEESGGYRLEAVVPASLLQRIKLGQTIPVAIETFEESEPIEAKVSEIVPEIDPASRTFIVKLSLPPNAAWRSGLYGRALIPSGVQSMLVVPRQAVMERGQIRSVVVVEGNIARRRLVTLGRAQGETEEVLSGLENGELVALQPDRVADGAAVRVQRSSQEDENHGLLAR